MHPPFYFFGKGENMKDELTEYVRRARREAEKWAARKKS